VAWMGDGGDARAGQDGLLGQDDYSWVSMPTLYAMPSVQYASAESSGCVAVRVRVRGPGLRTMGANAGLVDPIIVQQRVLDALHDVLKRTTAPIIPKLGHACTQSSATEAHSHNSI
jgi:hypothetical protein